MCTLITGGALSPCSTLRSRGTRDASYARTSLCALWTEVASCALDPSGPLGSGCARDARDAGRSLYALIARGALYARRALRTRRARYARGAG